MYKEFGGMVVVVVVVVSLTRLKLLRQMAHEKKVGVQKESKIYDPVQIKSVHAKQINQGTTWRQDNEDPPR